VIGIAELVLLVGIAACFGVFMLGGAFLVYKLVSGTANKGDWGLNLKPPTACPVCSAPLPMARVPKNLRQALWGGWTCSGCGKELDKWGRVLGA
jgi:hypothetical protein